MIKALKQEVEKAFADVIEKYHFRVKKYDKYSVYLLADTYTIEIYFDRDGLSFMYYDLSDNGKKIYNIWLYLINKRRNSLVFCKQDDSLSFKESLSVDLPYYANNIANTAEDILAGDKTWLKQYHWSTGTISQELFAQLINDQ